MANAFAWPRHPRRVSFPAFEHARFLGAAHATVQHNLGSSAFAAPPWQQRAGGNLPSPPPSDFDAGDLHLVPDEGFRAALANHLGVQVDRVEPTAGTTSANLSVFLDRCKPGTTVVVERPTYQPLAAVPQGLGAEVRFVDRRPGDWRLHPDDVADAADQHTALIVLASPNNPTGAVASPDDLRAFGEIAEQSDALVLVDQVYRELTDHPVAALHDRIVSTGGFNKCWGAAGLRVGWLVAHEDRIAGLAEIHRHASLAPPPWGEALAHALLQHQGACRRELEARLAKNHATYTQWLQTGPLEDQPHNRPPPWGLTAFADVGVADTYALAHHLLKHGILVIPGEFFGKPGRVRIGLGGDPAALPAALDALGAQLAAPGPLTPV